MDGMGYRDPFAAISEAAEFAKRASSAFLEAVHGNYETELIQENDGEERKAEGDEMSALSSPIREPESEQDPPQLDEAADNREYESDAVSVDHCFSEDRPAVVTLPPAWQRSQFSSSPNHGKKKGFAELVREHYFKDRVRFPTASKNTSRSYDRHGEESQEKKNGKEHKETEVEEGDDEEAKTTPSFSLSPRVSINPSVNGGLLQTCTIDTSKLPILFQGFIADAMHCCLQNLRTMRACEPFSELPLQDPALNDFLKLVSDPVDLKIIAERLDQGSYEAPSGEMKPELFWADVDKCWENCQAYHADNENSQPYRMAEEMRAAVGVVNEQFWQTLMELDPELQDRPESSEDNHIDALRAAVIAGRSGCHQRDPLADAERLLQGWTTEQLRRCVRALAAHPSAELFLTPFPWEEFELHDYLEVVEKPIDLGSIGHLLVEGAYLRHATDESDEDEVAPWVDAEAFWADVRRCWQNCLQYFDTDEELESVESCRSARLFRSHVEEVEAQFWEKANACWITDTGKTLQSVAMSAHADIASDPKSRIWAEGDSHSAAPIASTARIDISRGNGDGTNGANSSSSSSAALVGAASMIPPPAQTDDRACLGDGAATVRRCSNDVASSRGVGDSSNAQTCSDLAVEDFLEQDRIIHGWCQRKLRLCLPIVANYSTCSDLQSLRERLEMNAYNDEDGLLDPDPFWQDVRKSVNRSTCGNASALNVIQALEDDFFAALNVVEQTMLETHGNIDKLGRRGAIVASDASRLEISNGESHDLPLQSPFNV
eukprot:TRINITY_DN67375_c0_g1_i1.p1 TRINITY_DN67375_c0_g1~~TRINITY_DN67375_c0_g1_i1.p1  ORF type:complete len:775 (-),score=136.87 TRINITY_DN67375_c0_g1_i1:119-2443(-)